MIYIYVAIGLIAAVGFGFGGIQFAAGLFVISSIVLFWLSVRDEPRRAIGNTDTTTEGVAELTIGSVLIVAISWLIVGVVFGIAALLAVAAILLFLRAVPRARSFLDRMGNRTQDWLETKTAVLEAHRQKQTEKFDKALDRFKERAGV